MKKIVLGILLFLMMPFKVHAISYDITNYHVKAYIEANGDVRVNEILVLDGSFNGYERDLDYKPYLNDQYESSTNFQGSNITDIEIKGKYITSFSESLFTDTDFTTFEKVSYASNGDLGKYLFSNLSSGYRLRMYYPANNQKVAFYISYTIKDLITIYNDVAEIYYPFIGDAFLDDLQNIDIKVYLPSNDSSNYLRVWAHGALTGEVEKMDTNGLHAYVDKVEAGEVLDIRMTFDKSLVPFGTKIINVDYFDKIIEIETKRADAANALREELLATYNFVKYSAIILYIAMIGLGIFIYFKYGKSPKSGYYSKYNREFIDDYNVEVIDYLMKKQITPNAMSASIMNLIYKKNLSAKEISSEGKKKKEYEFTLENTGNINESEQILIDFLFERVGKNRVDSENKKCFSTKELKQYADGTKTCSSFISSYTKWKNNVITVGKNEKFYESHIAPKLISIIIFFLAFILFNYGMIQGVDSIFLYLLLLPASLLLIYGSTVSKKTEKGSLHYDKWKAFKNFLNDFGAFDLKELPEIVLWERYLVYATIFGLADKVEKSMNVRIQELEVSNVNYDYYPSFFYINLGGTINSSINNAINSAYSRQAANYSNSHSSSSSGGGFGGGFSGGSGFSGGGGGRGF